MHADDELHTWSTFFIVLSLYNIITLAFVLLATLVCGIGFRKFCKDWQSIQAESAFPATRDLAM